MESIKLNKIIKNKNLISFDYTVTPNLKKYFSEKAFVIEYPDNIENIPDAILAIPFVCNVLPIVWFTDSEFIIDELDEAFYNSIPEFKKGYITMYPRVNFLGKLTINKIVDCSYPDEGKCAMFYSGGLDSANTLVKHFDENPYLLSIWGSDIMFDNREGWEIVHKAISDTAEQFNLSEYVFHSSFRLFDDENKLTDDFEDIIGDNWWHGIKHGLGLIGHIAPFTYMHRVSKMYIASSFCTEDGLVLCASSPLIDNFIRISNCQVIHDGFEYNRQDKAHNVVEFFKGDTPIKLHVCWESSIGENCCHCEKCYRTIYNIWAEGADFRKFGFDITDNKISQIRYDIIDMARNEPNTSMISKYWYHIKNRALNNIHELEKGKYFDYMKWVLKADFSHPENWKLPLGYRTKQKLSENSAYQLLHNVKMKFR